MKHADKQKSLQPFEFGSPWQKDVAKVPVCCLMPLILSLALVSACTDRAQEPRVVARPVKVFRVGEPKSTETLTFAGEVKARHETVLSFRVAGKLTARPIEVGDRVRKGQIMASLDASDYRLAVQALKAQLKSAAADRDFSRDDLARYRELLDQQVVSHPELERHETAHTAARERVAALEAQLNQAANQLDYTDLLADRDGVVTSLNVESGQVVTAGQPVVTLAQLDGKEVHADIPEHRLSGIRPGQEVSMSLWADGERRFRAVIREIAASADPASRTYRVKASLHEGQDVAQLGMTATVWIPSHAPPRIAIPLSAVFSPQSDPAQPRVWRVDGHTGTVSSVPVRIGEPVDGEHIAVAGLAAGQWIVSAGVQRLAEGQAVRLPDEVASAVKGYIAENRGDQP